MEQQYSFLECMWMLSGNGCFGTALHFGVLSDTEKGTNWAYQPKLAVLRLSTALKEKYLSMDNKNAKQRAVVSNGTFI